MSKLLIGFNDKKYELWQGSLHLLYPFFKVSLVVKFQVKHGLAKNDENNTFCIYIQKQVDHLDIHINLPSIIDNQNILKFRKK
jgi:hypothetical protein